MKCGGQAVVARPHRQQATETCHATRSQRWRAQEHITMAANMSQFIHKLEPAIFTGTSKTSTPNPIGD